MKKRKNKFNWNAPLEERKKERMKERKKERKKLKNSKGKKSYEEGKKV